MGSAPEPPTAEEFIGWRNEASKHFDIDENLAIENWTGSSFYNINRAVRKDETLSNKPRPELEGQSYATVVAKLDSAIAKNTITKDVTVFRGFNGTRLAGAKVGDVFGDKGFVATSAKQSIADHFANVNGSAGQNRGTLVKLILPKGTHAIAIGYEHELLLGRNAQFKIESITRSQLPSGDGSPTGERTEVVARLVTTDAKTDSVEDDIRDLLKAGARKLSYAVDQSGLDKLAKKYAEATTVYQRKQLQRQLAGVLGADPLIADKSLSARVRTFIDHNVSLVTRIPNELHGQLADLVAQGFSESWLTPDLADIMMARFNIAEAHARLIARDQVGQLYADVNHDRQRNLGVERFVWRTVNDERVRGDPDGLYPKAIPSHFDLDGQTFSYDDPPINEASGMPFLPGDDYQCRCYAEPVLDDLLDDDDEEDTGDDDEEEPDDPSDDLGEDDREDSEDHFDFDESEPRDAHGEWTSGGGSGPEVVKGTFEKLTSKVKLNIGERHAVKLWSSQYYEEINAAARGGKKHGAIAKLDTAIAKNSMPTDTTVYRGISSQRFAGVKAGAVFTDKGFVATGLGVEVAKKFASQAGYEHHDGGALIRIHVPAGHPALAVKGTMLGESEILLPRNSKFRVTSVTQESAGNSVYTYGEGDTHATKTMRTFVDAELL